MTTAQNTTETKTKRLPWGWWLAIGLVIGLLALVGTQLAVTQAGGVAVGQTAPDFIVIGFDNTPLAGQTLKLSEARGRVVVVNFWASWCAPCRDEAADLERLWQAYGPRGVAVVGLAWSDTERESLKFINEFNQTYLNGPDLQTRAGDAYRVRAVPETYIIDQTGKLAWLKKGPTNFIELRTVLDELLK